MSFSLSRCAILLIAAGLLGSQPAVAFNGTKAGEEREVAGVKLCWCPSGKFTMGSPAGELERRPGEDQVEVTLTKGFWMGKYEVTQGQWKRVVGEFPGERTADAEQEFRLDLSWKQAVEEKAERLRVTMQRRPLVELAATAIALIVARRILGLRALDVTAYGDRADFRSLRRRLVLEISGTEVTGEFKRRHREKVAQALANPFDWDAYVGTSRRGNMTGRRNCRK